MRGTGSRALDDVRLVVRAVRLLVSLDPARFALKTILQTAAGAFPVVTAVATGLIVGAVVEGDTTRLSLGIALVAGVLLGGRVIGLVRTLVDFGFTQRVSFGLQQRVMSAVASVPGLEAFEDSEVRDRLALASQAGTGPVVFAGQLGITVPQVVTAAGSAFVVAMIAWWAPLLLIGATVPTAVLEWHYGRLRTNVEVSHAEDKRRSAYHRALGVGLRPAKEVRLFELGAWIIDRHERAWTKFFTPFSALVGSEVRAGLANTVFKVLLSATPFVYGFLLVTRDDLSVAAFTATLLSARALLDSAGFLASTGGSLPTQARFLPELYSTLELPRTRPGIAATGTQTPPKRPVREIRFDGVRFAYPRTTAPVLDGLDLVIPAGRCLALVGVNGAGKSTIVKLLCRFYDPDAGHISIDGTDIRELDLAELRRRIAVVFQDYVQYPFTALDNIGLGCVERRSDADLVRSAAARAGALELVEGLPDGLGTVLAREFGGVDLSGGEWQRIALARSLVSHLGRDASILVLDEPTAGLDVRLEHDLYARFSELTRGQTTLLVSHRMSTVRMADEIAVLDTGRVIEQGSHAELIAARGRYAELFELQARRFREGGELP